MEDKQTGFIIYVDAEMVRGAGKKAVRGIAKEIETENKTKKTVVPVDISVNISDSEKVKKAQAKVVKSIKKMTAEGFSASSDDIKNIKKELADLGNAMDKARVGRQNNLFKIISKQVDEINTAYKELRNLEKSTNARVTKVKPNKSSNKPNKPTRKARDLGPHSEEEIDANIRQENSRRYKGLKYIGPKLPRTGWVDPSATNTYEAKLSEISGHSSGLASQMSRSEKEFYEDPAHQSKTRKPDKEEFNKIWNDAKSKSKELSEIETARDLSRILTDKILPKLINDVLSNRDTEGSSKQFSDTVEAIYKLSKTAGINQYDTAKKEVDSVMQRFFNTKGNIGGTNGVDKTAGLDNEAVKAVIEDLFTKIEKKMDIIVDEMMTLEKTTKTSAKQKTATKDTNTFANKIVSELTASDQTQTQAARATTKAIEAVTNATEKQTSYDLLENSAERVADNKEGTANKTLISEVKADAATGMNTEANAERLFRSLDLIYKTLSAAISPKVPETLSETTSLALVPDLYRYFKNGKWMTAGVKDETEYKPTVKFKEDKTNHQKLYERYIRPLEKTPDFINDTLPTFGKKLSNILQKALNFTGRQAEIDRIMALSQEEQDKRIAESRERFGVSDSRRNVTTVGDKVKYNRFSALRGRVVNPLEGVKITEGINFDSASITKAFQTMIEKNQFNAQTGGGFWKNVGGAATFYLGQDSLEKSRAEADAMNTILGKMNDAVSDLVASIKIEESVLRGLHEEGKATFNEQGNLDKTLSSPEAIYSAEKMEDSKAKLRGVLAEAEKVNTVISLMGGNAGKVLKHIGFVVPELQDCNKIIKYLNSGLNKNGKALTFQKRTQEVLNYSYQLMARHVGQIYKKLLLSLNPIKWIKSAFSEFSRYSTKWQRTLNVIKYNIHAILEPFMDKVAQFLVNCIGFVDIISMKVQKAFGAIPISLFDQASADAQKIKEELEAASNVSAGFDELHDIGSDNSGANDLTGEIYTPQLSEEWQQLAEQIGDLFAGIITGDLGFGEVMTTILDIAWKGIKLIGATIWDAIKNSTIGQYIQTHWKSILGTLLKIFLAWELLKTGGKLLFNALFSGFTTNAGINALKNLFTDSNGIVGIGKNIGTLISGAILAVVGTMELADAINDSWNQGKSDATLGNSLDLTDSQTASDALQGALGGASAVIGGGLVASALGASVALGPLLVVAAGVAALAAVVVVGAEAWAYHAQQNKIANNEMLEAEDYAEQAAAANEKLAEVNQMVADATSLQNTQQEKLNQLEEEYGISLDDVNEKVALAGGNTDVLTQREKALYDQGVLTQESIDNYNRLLEIQLELQKQSLWAKEQEAIALDMAAGDYELAALRIEQAELQGTITTEEATAKRIQLYKEAGEEERANLLQNLTPEQRTLMAQYNGVTETETKELVKIWQESGEDIREAFLSGTDESVQQEFQENMNSMDNIIKQHQSFWRKAGDTIAEIFTFGKATTWTYNAEAKYEAEKEKGKFSFQSYDIGTNYVPSDGLAYLHQGEAVIPKKYNQPYQPSEMSLEEQLYMKQMISTMKSLDSTMKQGITVNGQFVQRGSDLVAVVNKTKSQTGADLLSNVAYAR